MLDANIKVVLPGMNDENKLYQLTCHLSPLLDQNQLAEAVERIKQLAVANEGLFLAEEELSADNIQKRKLAYPIDKYNESFYLTFNLLADSQKISQINSQLNLDNNIIRHILVAKQKPTAIPKEIIDYEATEKIESLAKKQAIPPTDAPAEEKLPSDDAKIERKEEDKTAADKEKPAAEKNREKVKIEELDQKLEEILNQ